MSDGDQMGEEKIEVKRARNSPKTPRATWERIRVAFEAGTYSSQRELAAQFGVAHDSLRKKIHRDKWNERQRTLQDKVSQVIEKKAVSQASEYLQKSFLRAENFTRMVDASVSQLSTTSEGIPLVEPDDLDKLSRVETRVHEWSKSCLRIPAVAQVDLTSKGLSVGESIVSAIEKLRESGQAMDITEAQADRILQMEIVP